MTTIRDIIEDAFDDLEIKSAEVSLTDEELATGIRRLNRIMVTLAASGLNVGYTKAVDIDDLYTAPDWFEEVSITQLAIRLAPGFGAQVTPALAAAALAAIQIVELRLHSLQGPTFGNTLPIGAGNYQGDNAKFFRNDDESLLYTGSGAGLADDEEIQLNTD